MRLVTQLFDNDLPLAAFAVLHKAMSYAPLDTTLARFAAAHSQPVTVNSSPPGAQVAIQDYVTFESTAASLGVTPIVSVSIPKGCFRWRVAPPTGAPFISAPDAGDQARSPLDSVSRAPKGMVFVHGRQYQDYVAFIGWVGPYALPAFDIDRYEVTNAEYQEFVDAGGYRDHQYWKEPLIAQGKVIGWDAAQILFRDKRGRTSPLTWSSGHFAAGQGDFPVGGISWYEAAAHAEFRGKRLPTMAQWHEAAPRRVSNFISRMATCRRRRRRARASSAASVRSAPTTCPATSVNGSQRN